MARYTTAHIDEVEEFTDAGCRYRPIRHQLGIDAFGVTAWSAQTAGDLVVHERDDADTSADQELFLVLRGHAVFDLDGDRVDAPAGTFVFAPPGTGRTASATEAGTAIILVEGTPGAGYEPRGWELWAPLFPLYEAGEYAEVADRLSDVVAASPQYPMLFFNLACCESLSGRTSDALDHLRQAIEMSDEFRTAAMSDSDLDPIRDEPAFERLVREPGFAGELERLHADILDAWNRRDSEAYADCFVDDGLVIGFDGSEMHGRSAITEQLAAIFADHLVASYVRVVRGVRQLGEHTASLHAVVGMVPPGGDDVMADRHAVQILVGTLDDGRWRAVSLQNTPAELHGQPGAVDALTEELRAVLAHRPDPT